MRRHPRGALGLLVLPVLLGACVGRTTHTQVTTDEESSYGSSISVHGSSAKAMLERGKQHVLEGRFTSAIASFRQAATDPDAESAIRAEALFELGEAHANLLNPARDAAKAAESFRKLIEEYPDSEFAEEAARYLERLEGS